MCSDARNEAHWRLYGPAADIRAVAEELGLPADSTASEASITFYPSTVALLAKAMSALWERHCLDEVRLTATVGSPEAPIYTWEPIGRLEFAQTYLSRKPAQFVRETARRTARVIEHLRRNHPVAAAML